MQAESVAATNTKDSVSSASSCLPTYGLPKRVILGFMIFTGLVVVYCLRICISVAAANGNNTMYSEYDWNGKDQGYVLSGFFYGYLFTNVPGGLLARRFGAKIVFGWGIFISCITTLATPLVAANLSLLVLVRAATGLGEGVTYPALYHMLATWTPSAERSRMVTFVSSGAFVGTCVALPVTGVVVQHYGWRYSFYLFGLCGLVWTLAWIAIAVESPHEHPGISDEELNLIRGSVGETMGHKKSNDKSLYTKPHRAYVAVMDETPRMSSYRKTAEPVHHGSSPVVHAATSHSSATPPPARLAKKYQLGGRPSSAGAGESSPLLNTVGGTPNYDVAAAKVVHVPISSNIGIVSPSAPVLRVVFHVLKYPVTYALILNNFASNWLFYTTITELPNYISKELHFSIQNSGIFSVLPYVCVTVTTPLGGMLADTLMRKGVDRLRVRTAMEVTSLLVSGAFLVGVSYLGTSHSARAPVLVFLCISVSAIGLATSGYAALLIDVAGPGGFAGVMLGVSNTAGTLGGALSPLITGFMLDSYGIRDGYRIVFWLALAIQLVGVTVWLWLATLEPIGPVAKASYTEWDDDDDAGFAGEHSDMGTSTQRSGSSHGKPSYQST